MTSIPRRPRSSRWARLSPLARSRAGARPAAVPAVDRRELDASIRCYLSALIAAACVRLASKYESIARRCRQGACARRSGRLLPPRRIGAADRQPLERTRSDAADLHQLVEAAKRAVAFAVLDDARCELRSDAGQQLEVGCLRAIEIDRRAVAQRAERGARRGREGRGGSAGSRSGARAASDASAIAASSTPSAPIAGSLGPHARLSDGAAARCRRRYFGAPVRGGAGGCRLVGAGLVVRGGRLAAPLPCPCRTRRGGALPGACGGCAFDRSRLRRSPGPACGSAGRASSARSSSAGPAPGSRRARSRSRSRRRGPLRRCPGYVLPASG